MVKIDITRLVQYRKKKGVSQNELVSAACLKSRYHLSLIESGKRDIKLDELIVALNYLEVSLEDFLNPFLPINPKYTWRVKEDAE